MPTAEPSRWATFEAAAPELAARARERIELFGWVLAGTIRKDGTPRISPVEAHFVNGHLMIVMIAGTHKARDLFRDPRTVLNTPITSAGDPGAELKLRGRAVVTRDAAQCEATADEIERTSGWRPPHDWHFFSVELDDVALIDWVEGAMTMTRWTHDAGVTVTSRPAPRLS